MNCSPIPWRFSPVFMNSCFGLTTSACVSSPESSMSKFTMQINASKLKKISLVTSKKKVLATRYLKSLHYKTLTEQIKLMRLKKLKLAQEAKVDCILNKAAVVIQAHVKGWQCRKKYEYVLVQAARLLAQDTINELIKFSARTYYIGKAAFKATLTVQRIFRGNQCRSASKVYIETRKNAIKEGRDFVQILACRLRVMDLRLKLRVIKLRNIRERLALISLRKLLRSQKKKNKILIKKKKTDIRPLAKVIEAVEAKVKGLIKLEDATESSDSSIEVEIKPRKSKKSRVMRKHKPRLSMNTPILIEKGRSSQIWVETLIHDHLTYISMPVKKTHKRTASNPAGTKFY